MSKGNTELLRFRIPPDWLPLIQDACIKAGIKPREPGLTGGNSEWARRLVARELGIVYTEPVHGRSPRR